MTKEEFVRLMDTEPENYDEGQLEAFRLLNELVPGKDIISWAEHDLIWLSTNVEKLAAVITPEQVMHLRACGVRFDSEWDGLAMYI